MRPRTAGTIDIVMTDVSGRRIETRSIDSAGTGEVKLEWNCEDLGAGFYFLRIAGAGIDEQRRVTVLK
jgi:hypothetical protein